VDVSIIHMLFFGIRFIKNIAFEAILGGCFDCHKYSPVFKVCSVSD